MPVDKLKVGLYVDLNLKWTEHPFLFKRFRIKQQWEIDTIKELGLETVTVHPKRSLIEREKLAEDANTAPEQENDQTGTTSAEALWQHKREKIEEARKYRDERRRLMREYKETTQRVRRLTSDLSEAPANAMRDAHEIVNHMAAHFEQQESVLMNLVNLPDDGYSTHAHSLNVTVLALGLARSVGISGDELREIALGALLHDLGMATLPGKITLKTGAFNEQEQKLYELHAARGGKLARQVGALDERIIEIIERHHHMLDGTGFPPTELKPETISRATRVVTIANIYDNLCNPRQASAALPPKQAMAVLYKRHQNQLDPELLAHFIKSMGVYPPGTIVRLSDSSIGLVVTVNPDNILKPMVLIYNPDIPRNESLMMDLAQRDDITVDDALKPSEYPVRIYEHLGLKERLGYFYSSGH